MKIICDWENCDQIGKFKAPVERDNSKKYRLLCLEHIKIFDDTFKHKSHKSFISGKYHLRLEIFSKYLKSLPRIDAQKKVLNILKREIQEKIHAIQIIIK